MEGIMNPGISTCDILGAGVASALVAASAGIIVAADGPAQGARQRVDDSKARGSLRVAVLGEMPWWIENTTGEGEPFARRSGVLASEYAKQQWVTLENVS